MKTVNIAELKNHLSTYIGYAKAGEEVVIRDRKLPVARLVRFEPGDASEEELQLIAEGKLRPSLRSEPIDWDAFWDEFDSIPTGNVPADKAIQALIDDREDRF